MRFFCLEGDFVYNSLPSFKFEFINYIILLDFQLIKPLVFVHMTLLSILLLINFVLNWMEHTLSIKA